MQTNPPLQPVLTIGIPTYNRAGSLPRAISSALQQTVGALEVLVVDNASSDTTEDLCRAWQQRDGRVLYVRQPRNVGSTRNFRTALDQASAPHFMWLADDDWLDPDYARACLDQLLAQGHVLVAGKTRFYRGDEVVDEGERVQVDAPDGGDRVRQFYDSVVHNPAHYGVARTSDMRAAGDYPNVLGGDWLWVAAMAFRGTFGTAEDVVLHRSAGGVSADLTRTALSLGQPAWHGRRPYTVIAVNAGRHVLGGVAFADAPPSERYRLALVVTLTVLWRHEVFPDLVRSWRRLSPGSYARVRALRRRRRSCTPVE